MNEDPLSLMKEILDNGATPIATFLKKDDNYGLVFNETTNIDPITIAMMCHVLVTNYINFLDDSKQNGALSAVYDVFEKMKNYPAEYTKDGDEVFGKE
jgi:hypothetical protein